MSPSGSDASDAPGLSESIERRRLARERRQSFRGAQREQRPDGGAIDAVAGAGQGLERLATGTEEQLERRDPGAVAPCFDAGHARLRDPGPFGERALREPGAATGLAGGGQYDFGRPRDCCATKLRIISWLTGAMRR